MQLRHLKTFTAVANTLNFTRAAEHVHLSQSSVTEQVQALEADLGVKLFDRSRRRLTLTPAGQRLLGYAAELIDLADEAYSAVVSTFATISGNLVIGGLETLCSTWLPEMVAEFSRRYPAVEMVAEFSRPVRRPSLRRRPNPRSAYRPIPARRHSRGLVRARRQARRRETQSRR